LTQGGKPREAAAPATHREVAGGRREYRCVGPDHVKGHSKKQVAFRNAAKETRVAGAVRVAPPTVGDKRGFGPHRGGDRRGRSRLWWSDTRARAKKSRPTCSMPVNPHQADVETGCRWSPAKIATSEGAQALIRRGAEQRFKGPASVRGFGSAPPSFHSDGVGVPQIGSRSWISVEGGAKYRYTGDRRRRIQVFGRSRPRGARRGRRTAPGRLAVLRQPTRTPGRGAFCGRARSYKAIAAWARRQRWARRLAPRPLFQQDIKDHLSWSPKGIEWARCRNKAGSRPFLTPASPAGFPRRHGLCRRKDLRRFPRQGRQSVSHFVRAGPARESTCTNCVRSRRRETKLSSLFFFFVVSLRRGVARAIS